MSMRKICLILFFISIFFTASYPQSYSDTDIVSVDRTPEIMKKLQANGFDILMVKGGKIYVVCTIKELLRLQEEGIPFTVETANFYPFREKELAVKGGINGDYHSYSELEGELMALESTYPQLAKVFDIGDSLENRNIYALKISDNVSVDELEAEVFFCGNHHAREWITVEVPFLLGKYLVENYERSPQIKKLVDTSEIWIVPLVNPDGLEYSIHVYRYWRKNRRNNGDGSYGVDLNRNYGYQWGCDNRGSSPDPSSGVYRGPVPFSEPESQAIRNLFLQKDFQAMVTYHNYSQVILYPWGYTTVPADKVALMRGIAAQMSQLIQNIQGNVYEYGQSGADLYLTNGDTTDWTFGIFGIPSYTIELPPVDVPHGGFFNAEEDIITIFEENLPAALYLIEWAIQNFNPGEIFRQEKTRALKRPWKPKK